VILFKYVREKYVLRSLGINMVLAGAGSVVCATAAVVHPLPVLVSMRLSDSLSDSESYFRDQAPKANYG
jgi:DNA mismatch repair ATPase MutS